MKKTNSSTATATELSDKRVYFCRFPIKNVIVFGFFSMLNFVPFMNQPKIYDWYDPFQIDKLVMIFSLRYLFPHLNFINSIKIKRLASGHT